MNVNHVTLIVLAMALAAMSSLNVTEAEVYRVGGDMGWLIPPGGAATYASWASQHTFEVENDSLVFDFIAGEHDVTVVTKEHFETCNTTDPLYQYEDPGVSFGSSSPATIYFTCSFAGHCARGQKVAINTVLPSPPPSASPLPSASDESAATLHRKLTINR